MNDFKDRVAVITGGAAGIGRAMARAFASRGAHLVLADVRDGKVVAWNAMPTVWSLVFNKEDFFKYVQQGISDYLEKR